jgi:hypothetical protein
MPTGLVAPTVSRHAHTVRRRVLPGALGTIAALAPLTATACRDIITPPELPDGAVPLAVPAIYREWWADAERCSSLEGDFERLHWFVIPGTVSFEYQGGRYDGVWWSDYHWIALSEARVSDSLVVRHEMLHDLLGRGDHPPQYYQELCARVVSCGAGCRVPAAQRSMTYAAE